MKSRVEVCIAVAKDTKPDECEAFVKALAPLMAAHGGEVTFITRHDFQPGTSCVSYSGPRDLFSEEQS